MAGESKDIDRYSMIGTAGGCNSYLDTSGEWVKYADVCDLGKEIFRDMNSGQIELNIETIKKYL